MTSNEKEQVSPALLNTVLTLENLTVISITNDYANNNAKMVFQDIRGVRYFFKLANTTRYSMAGSGMFALVLEAFRYSLKLKVIRSTGYIDAENFHYLDAIEIGCN